MPYSIRNFRYALYHHLNGHVSLSSLNCWKQKTPMIKVISDILALFDNQNPDSPYNAEMAREYESN